MRYPGGKGGCFRNIINLMPMHDVYIETHLGSGAVLRHKRPVARSIGLDIDPQVIDVWRNHDMVNTEIVHSDAVAFLEQYPFNGTELVYCDPPYPVSTRRKARIYRYDYTEQDHRHLLESIMQLPCKVMISSYDNLMYRQALQEWEMRSFSATSHVGVRKESIWMNYSKPLTPYDTQYLGDDFRMREAIRKRHKRLTAKIGQMPTAERKLLWAWAKTNFADEFKGDPL